VCRLDPSFLVSEHGSESVSLVVPINVEIE
jgi:hypothetical protein